MDRLTPRQIVLLAVAAGAVTSLVVSLLAFGFLAGLRPGQVVERIIEQVPGPGASEREVSERILRQDELVVSVVKRVSPAVSSVVATKDVPVIEQFFISPFEGDSFFEQFRIPQFRQRGTQRRETGAGSGFVVSADGLILTNKHVVADTAADYTVILNDGTKLSAAVLARDPVLDLAVLRVDRKNLSALSLGDSEKLEIGQTVIAIGNALGDFPNTVSVGVISGLGRTVVAVGPEGSEQLQELIQTDAAINPGNSGGPLLNLRGEVIGVNTAIARGAENIGFAIPINKAKRDIESVKAVGRIIYPFLGIRYVIITKEFQEKQKLPVDYGALVVKGEGEPAIFPSSPAERVGLREGDIILEFNGERIEVTRTLASLITKYKVGDTVTLKVLRGGETLSLSAALEERK